MLRFLESMDALYGGVVGYLGQHGVSDEELQRLRDNLTEPE